MKHHVLNWNSENVNYVVKEIFRVVSSLGAINDIDKFIRRENDGSKGKSLHQITKLRSKRVVMLAIN